MPEDRVPDAELIRLRYEKGMTHRAIAKMVGYKSDGTVRSRFKRMDKAGKLDDVKQEAKLEPFDEWVEHQGNMPNWREIVEHAREGADIYNRINVSYDFVHRKINTDKPIAIVFASDFHLGNHATDYSAFLDTADFLKESGFYMIVVGSDPEFAINRFRSSEAVHSQVLPPVMQIEAQRLWLEWLQDQLIAGCWDNHLDERLEMSIGMFSGIGWPKKAPYFHAKGLLKLTVGDIEYEIAMTHRHKGSSIYHDFQPVFRLFREFYPADICVTAHTHKPGYTEFCAYPEMRRLLGRPLMNHFILTGTFLAGHHTYTERNFKGRGVLGLPTIVLDPHTFDITYFRHPDKALRYINA